MNSVDQLYADIVCEPTFRKTAEALAVKSGVRSDLRGYVCLIDAVILYGTGSSESFCDIYRIIGELRRLKYKTVMREITYCIAQSYKMPDKLSELIGIPFRSTDIHSGMVIACLGKLFSRPDVSLYR